MPWTNEPSLGTARNGLAAATCDAPAPAYGYWIYAVGGNNGSGVVATVEAYAPGGSWSPVASLNVARENLAATSGPGRLYALGGDNGSSALATLEIYDPAAGTWTTAASMPTPRSALAASTDRSGFIYAIGGLNGSGSSPNYLSTVEIFNPTTSTWSTGKPMPTPRSGLVAVTGPDGKIYAIGGQNSTIGILTTVEIFDPATNSWTTGMSPLPSPLTVLAAAVGPDGLIYVMGGRNSSSVPQNTVYSYNPATPLAGWTVQSPMLTAQTILAGCTGPDGLVYAIAGQIFCRKPSIP